MNTLATLYALREHLGFGVDDTNEDRRLLMALLAATSHIERTTHRRFSPYRATLLHDIDPAQPTIMVLKDDLLTLIAIKDTESIDIEDVLLLPGDSLRLQSGESFQYEASPLQAVAVTALWGWHDDWGHAWQTADTLQSTITSSSSTLTVADADGSTSQESGPRFQVGQLIRIEEEYMHVLKLNATNNTITVVRGVNGTQPASHATSAVITVYRPAADVEMLCLQMATWFYRQPDDASKLPQAITNQLLALRRVRIKA